MVITAAADLLAALRQHQILKPAQLDELARMTEGKKLDVRSLAQHLIQQGWLTPYQANQVLQGGGQGLTLGSYIIQERLGEGGMGQVFKARHKGLDRICALKLIRKERLDHPDAVKRFHREVRAAAQLDHPNIVLAFDADQIGATHLLVTEFVDGTDLNELVKQNGPQPVAQVCEFIRQAALGLQQAHERGLLHRDIKPHNLLLSKAGIVKVLDLGLARFVGGDGVESTSTLTKEGAVMGTPDYISPEQAMDSHDVDIRSDLYSLGCVFYFLLTGQVPFPGGTLGSKLVQHKLEEPTPVDKIRPEVPPGVVAVVRKLMAKDPKDRYQTPGEVAAVLASGGRVVPGARELSAGDAAFGSTSANEGLLLKTAITPFRLVRRIFRIPGRAGWIIKGMTALLLVLGLAWMFRGEEKPGPGTANGDGPERLVTNSIGMKLRYIPPGKFLMGSTQEEIERFKKEPHSWEPKDWENNEGPRHEVRITTGFYLGIHEVTQEQFEKVTGKNPARFKGASDLPVEQVAWHEAVDFCRKLSELPEEQQAGRTYRLPTEAEWEYACRAGTTTIFHWGDSLASQQANFDGMEPFGGGGEGPNLRKTAKVGSYDPNAWGLYDMHGNVWEWCLDGPRPYTPAAITDPRGPVTAGEVQVQRGGSWTNGGWYCRSALRNPYSHSLRVGFRVVGSLVETRRH